MMRSRISCATRSPVLTAGQEQHMRRSCGSSMQPAAELTVASERASQQHHAQSLRRWAHPGSRRPSG